MSLEVHIFCPHNTAVIHLGFTGSQNTSAQAAYYCEEESLRCLFVFSLSLFSVFFLFTLSFSIYLYIF
jgi:hypothetical protein